MRDIYITHPGEFRRKDNTIVFSTKNMETVLPVEETISLHAFADITLNSDALEFLGKHNIPLHFYDYFGNYRGSFAPKEAYPSGNILLSQVHHYTIPHLRLNIAREIICASIHNMRKTLMQYSIPVQKIGGYYGKADRCGKIKELMGYEANARKYYYASFNKIIKNEKFLFLKREIRPPPDPTNALLSFGNTLLYNIVLNEIFKTPLDPKISYLHEPFERRFSLTLDLAEIFKPIIVDRVIFTLVNKSMLKDEDFEKEADYCFLSKPGRKKFIRALDGRLMDTIKHPSLKRNVSYRYLIRLECYKLIKHILEEKPFRGFRMYW